MWFVRENGHTTYKQPNFLSTVSIKNVEDNEQYVVQLVEGVACTFVATPPLLVAL